MTKLSDYASQHYSNDHLYDDKHIPKADKIRIRKILRLMGTGKKILDIGCYNGTISKEIKKQGNKVYGVDVSKEAIKKANINGIIAKVINAESKLPFPDNSFDVVFAGEIIEHIVDTDFFMEEIKRVLKYEGELIITTPNTASFGRRLMLLFGKNPFFEASLGFPKDAKAGHVRFFIRNLLEQYLIYKGFKVTYFCSDVINLPFGMVSESLAIIVPNLGHSLIIKAKMREP